MQITQQNIIHLNKIMTRITIQILPINWFSSSRNDSDRFSKHIGELYPDIRPWYWQRKTQQVFQQIDKPGRTITDRVFYAPAKKMQHEIYTDRLAGPLHFGCSDKDAKTVNNKKTKGGWRKIFKIISRRRRRAFPVSATGALLLNVKIQQHSNWLDTPPGPERPQVRILPAIPSLTGPVRWCNG